MSIQYVVKKTFAAQSVGNPKLVIRGAKGATIGLLFRADEKALKAAKLIEDAPPMRPVLAVSDSKLGKRHPNFRDRKTAAGDDAERSAAFAATAAAETAKAKAAKSKAAKFPKAGKRAGKARTPAVGAEG